MAFVRQSANLWHVKAWMQQMAVAYLQGHLAPCQIIDKLPLPICKLARRHTRKIFTTEPIFAFSSPHLPKASVLPNKKHILVLRADLGSRIMV